MTNCTITFGDLLGDNRILSFDEVRRNNLFRSDNLVLNYLHYQKLKKIFTTFSSTTKMSQKANLE